MPDNTPHSPDKSDIDPEVLAQERASLKDMLSLSRPFLIGAGIGCFVLVIIALVLYLIQFGACLSPIHDRWGQFGDFIGGLFNPVFGFVSLIAILFTIHLQLRALLLNAKELAATREEMSATREAQATIADDNKANAIVDLFQTYTDPYFYDLSRSSWNVLVATVESEAYEEHLLNTLFLHKNQFPPKIDPALLSQVEHLFEIDLSKSGDDHRSLEQREIDDRHRLDELLNFFSIIALRSADRRVFSRCDFFYEWYRPMLWRIADLRYAIYLRDREVVAEFCPRPRHHLALVKLDVIYEIGAKEALDPVKRHEAFKSHPMILRLSKGREFKPAFTDDESKLVEMMRDECIEEVERVCLECNISGGYANIKPLDAL